MLKNKLRSLLKIPNCLCMVYLLILFTGRISALQQTISFQKIPFYEGQHLLTVWDITQDSVGYVWFASNKGIFRYDGYRFKHYILEKDKNITWSSKVLMTIDPQGDLWIIFQHSLYKYNPVKESFDLYWVNSYQNGMRFFSITSDSSYIWLGNNRGAIYKIDKNTFELNKLSLKKDQYQNKILILELSIADSCLWIGSNIGLYKYNYCKSDTNTVPAKILFPSDNFNSHVRDLLIDDGNNLFFGTTECKLNHLRNGMFQQYDWSNKKRPDSKLETSRINSMCFDNNKNIWIASNSAGVLFFNRKSKQFSSSCVDTDLFQGLEPDPFETIFVDKSGIVWVSRASQGIFRSVIPPFKVTNYETIINPADSCKNDYLNNIAELSNGRLVFSIDNNGLLFFNPIFNSFSFVKHEKGKLNSLPCNNITAIICDKNDNLWLGSTAGLIRYDVPHNLFEQYYPEPDSINNHYSRTQNRNYISSLCAWSDSILWVATNYGIYKFNTSRQIFTEKYSTDSLSYIIPEKSIQQRAKPTCLEKDAENILWVGTATAGIFLFDPHQRKFIHQYMIERMKSFPIIVNDIYCDSQKRIWVSSHTNGIHFFDNTTGTFINFSNQRGMISAGVDKFVEDSLSNLWLCCPNGIMLFNPMTSTFTSYNQKDNFQFHALDKNDWYNIKRNPIFNKTGKYITSETVKTTYIKSQTTGYTSRDGTLYFAGPNGFTQIRPDFLNQESSHKVFLSGFHIFNEPIHFDQPIYEVKEIKLSYKDYIFSFEFMFTNTSFVDRNKFAYWLQGFEKDWQYTSSNNTREYINIPPGKYTMLVKACSAYGIWTKKPLSIDIIITPPFWQTWWFRISIGLLLAGLIGLVFWMRISAIQRQKRNLETQVKLRTKELHRSNEQLVDEIRFRRKAEEKLRKSEEEYRDLFDNAYDVIWITDLEGRIQAVNHYFASLLGYKREEIIGTYLLDFISPEHHFRALRNYRKFQQNQLVECEINFNTKNNGIRILWMKIRAIKDNGNVVGIHGIGRDSTELKKAQAELREAEAAKRESIKQLTLKIAHEIKNPLASITSSAQLVASSKDTRDKPKIQRHMNVINKSVNTCNQVIREMYAFTHKPVMNFSVIHLTDLINSLQISAESRLASCPNIRLTLEKDVKEGLIYCDKFRLEQAFMNLINNGIDAMGDTGTLSIRIYHSGDKIAVDISDTGCGMSPESIEKLYTPFVTSKSAGFGLGMPVVKDIIDAHQATIDVRSEINKGTTFTIRFNEYNNEEN